MTFPLLPSSMTEWSSGSVRRVSQGLAFAVKVLRNPVELARELYPTRGFKWVSGLDSIAFLDNWQVAKSAEHIQGDQPLLHTRSSGFLQRHSLQERRQHSSSPRAGFGFCAGM